MAQPNLSVRQRALVLAAIADYRCECATYGYVLPRAWEDMPLHDRQAITEKAIVKELESEGLCPH